MEDINTSAENQEVADPEETSDESAENQEVADPETDEEGTDTTVEDTDETEEEEGHVENDADSAFAEMRRRNQELERENERQKRALGMYFESNDPTVEAFANALGIDEETVRQALAEEDENESIQSENEALKEQLGIYAAQQAWNEDLKEIQSINPDIKSIDDLGDVSSFIESGMRGKDLYYAAQAKKLAEEKIPPKEIGKVNRGPQSKDFISEKEYDAMSDEEIDKNFELIRKSMGKW